MLWVLPFAAQAGFWPRSEPEPGVTFDFDPAPTLDLLVHGERSWRPRSVTGVTGDPEAPCTCDRSFLTCEATDDREVLVSWKLESIDDWPVTPGHAGTCRHGDLVIPVDVRFVRRRPETWQRGDELMVAVTEGLYIMERHDTDAPVDARGLGVPEQSEVWCERDHHGVKVYVWGAAAEPGVHPCLAWDSGKLDVRLVPYEGD